MADKLLSMLSLCRKAGKLEWGARAAKQCVGRGSARLVLISADASDSTALRLPRMCGENGIPLIQLGISARSLGEAIGQASTSAMAVNDGDFAGQIQKLHSLSDGNGGII